MGCASARGGGSAFVVIEADALADAMGAAETAGVIGVMGAGAG
jgi:hypothetical protein